MKFNNRNVFVSPSAKIGHNVRIGDNTVIYDNVEIGDNTTICNDCVIGEPLNAYYTDPNYQQPQTLIGPDSLIRSHNILYAGCRIGSHFNTGHRVTIRENMQIGHHVMVGTLSDLMGESVIGNYTRIYNNVHICQFASVGSYCFLFPYVIFTNDPTPPSYTYKGADVGDYVIIAVHSVLLPKVKIGNQAFIGANTTVTKDVDPGKLVIGNPGKAVADVTAIKSQTDPTKSHFPWMYHFDRGLPWQGIGYETWLSQNLT
jgi:UDP-3-O-[3-hydroxymyristoyl] glucosamine N-acyltransferase